MKAITLWQPWAHLIAIGAKNYETRSWRTSHRGPMAIHAARVWTLDMAKQCYEEPFYTLLRRAGIRFPDRCDETNFPRLGLAFGAVVAIADLVDVVDADAVVPNLGPQERAFGDFTHGRYAWRYERPRLLARPIPCKGRQGLFEVPDPEPPS